MATEIGQRIKEARLARGWSQEQLAAAAGTTQSTIERAENGGAQRPRFLPEIASALGITVPGLPQPKVLGEGYRPPPEFFGARDLPVYSAVEGGPGEMVVSTDPIEIVPRPWYLRNVKDGFAVLVTGESMIPVYEPGDIVVVNPKLPPIRNKNAIFIAGEDLGEFRATVKRLVRATEQLWRVRQFNPPGDQAEEFDLEKRVWSKAYRVVGKYEGG